MDILTLFVVVPALTALLLCFARNLNQARWIALLGMTVQFLMSLNLIFAYQAERKINDSNMVFQ